SGTLKSERTRTRLPRRSPRESMVFMSTPGRGPAARARSGLRHMTTSACAGRPMRTRTSGFTPRRRRSELLADEHGERDEAVRVAPLVVVPGDDLDLVADHLGELRVEDALVRVRHDVRRDDVV